MVVDKNGVESSAFGYLDHASTLLYLNLFENEIEHVADAGNCHAQVIIRWQTEYVAL